MWIKRQVVMLPTNQKANIPFYCSSDGLYLKKEYRGNSYTPQHLYIVSDEPIKVGDWVLKPDGTIIQMTHNNIVSYLDSQSTATKKIIATTDKYLELPYNGGRHEFLPHPSQSFIEKYVEEYNKGNIITEVMVEYEKVIPNPQTISKEFDFDDIVFNLKVNIKDNTITIRRVKDSWNKEELIKILADYTDTLFENSWSRNGLSNDEYSKNWIDKNL